MYYANRSSFDKTAQKIIKEAIRYKVISGENDVNAILCSNLTAAKNNCVLCTNDAVILGRRKLGVIYFADVYNYSVITSITYQKAELSIVLGGGQTVKLDIAAGPDDFNAFVNYVLGKAQPKATSAPVSATDEIKKYKELLDMGIITESEFMEKKERVIGIIREKEPAN